MTLTTWLVLALVALSVGVSKSALPGLSTLGVALIATVMPAKESTGLLLLLLLCGDLVAVSSYWRQADWRLLSRMLLPVLGGVLVGVVFLARVDDLVMRRTIGAVLLALLAVRAVRWFVDRRSARRAERDAAQDGSGDAGAADTADMPVAVVASVPAGEPAAQRPHLGVGAVYGTLAGFTTMVANAGGPVMSLYLLSVGATKLRFMGTAACFFFATNLVKLPFSIGLSLVTVDTLRTALVLVPLVLLGAVIGRRLLRSIDQKLFERLVIGLTITASIFLLR
ncbi:sulfite exporter TauE/SafE family protein [Sanguibacter sp. 4.1]|uniref:Probable membrane transporter protein n=1 Tax=Sanguibacter biliveldensis TaxID=3030830 RepID=A0AAF0ZA66_9MICO|nr:sulfite exporter TauE/SafE family protein [Sanguibacter sp. 4.1]WPF83729.1 sulfite exporter TauE/SafE family protein [Sanguibacter sp. 4.1]